LLSALVLLALSCLELAVRQQFGLLIPRLSDYSAVLFALALPLLCASALSLCVVAVILRLRGSRPVSLGQLVPGTCVDAVTRLLFAEAWLGAAEEAHAMPALLPGLVYVVLLPTALTWMSLVLFTRISRRGPSSLGTLSLLCGTLLLSGLLLWSFPRSYASEPAATDSDNLLLVTIDTWRHDHLSSHPRAVAADLTPRLDELATRGLLFTQARAHSPLTVPSHAAMLSGLRPWEMGLVSNSGRVSPGVRWLPELLEQEGFVTGAVVSGAVLRGRRGFARGFARFHDDLHPAAGLRSLVLTRLLAQLGIKQQRSLFRATADRAVRRSQSFIARQRGRWFLWMHLYDPHGPFEAASEDAGPGAPEAALAALPDPCLYSQRPRDGFSLAGALAAFGVQQGLPSCSDTRLLSQRVRGYQREVRGADAAVGELLDWLQQRGELASTSVIVTADHGESLTEHGEWMSHQFSPYEPVLRVPLIVVPAGGTTGQVSTALVEHRDLPATAAELVGLRSAVAGRSWTRQLGAEAGRPTVASLAPARPGEHSGSTGGPHLRVAVRDRESSLVLGPGKQLEFYDLQADPAQLRDLNRDEAYQPPAELVDEASKVSSRFLSEAQESPTLEDPELDALRELGYRD